jgi:hypothetical protein
MIDKCIRKVTRTDGNASVELWVRTDGNFEFREETKDYDEHSGEYFCPSHYQGYINLKKKLGLMLVVRFGGCGPTLLKSVGLLQVLIPTAGGKRSGPSFGPDTGS